MATVLHIPIGSSTPNFTFIFDVHPLEFLRRLGIHRRCAEVAGLAIAPRLAGGLVFFDICDSTLRTGPMSATTSYT